MVFPIALPLRVWMSSLISYLLFCRCLRRFLLCFVLVGYFMLAKQEDGHYDLNNLAVLPEKRHLGYGAKMIAFAKQKVTELGGKKIKVGIIEDSWIIKNYYQWNGFVHIGTQKYDHLPFTVGYLEWNAEGEEK